MMHSDKNPIAIDLTKAIDFSESVHNEVNSQIHNNRFVNQANNTGRGKKQLCDTQRRKAFADLELKLEGIEDSKTRQNKLCNDSKGLDTINDSDSVMFDPSVMKGVNKLEEISDQLQQFFYRTRTRKSKLRPSGCATLPMSPMKVDGQIPPLSKPHEL